MIFAQKRNHVVPGTGPIDMANIKSGKQVRERSQNPVNQRTMPAVKALVWPCGIFKVGFEQEYRIAFQIRHGVWPFCWWHCVCAVAMSGMALKDA